MNAMVRMVYIQAFADRMAEQEKEVRTMQAQKNYHMSLLDEQIRKTGLFSDIICLAEEKAEPSKMEVDLTKDKADNEVYWA